MVSSTRAGGNAPSVIAQSFPNVKELANSFDKGHTINDTASGSKKVNTTIAQGSIKKLISVFDNKQKSSTQETKNPTTSLRILPIINISMRMHALMNASSKQPPKFSDNADISKTCGVAFKKAFSKIENYSFAAEANNRALRMQDEYE